MNRGVMDVTYAEDRRSRPHLQWRYQLRAFEAVRTYRRMSAQRPSHRVLDLGAADGLTLLEIRRLLDASGHFHGVELSDALLQASGALPDDTRLVQGDVMRLPDSLQPGSYDLVVALAVLEHLPDPLACLREAHRMLKPGGIFVATCPNPIWDSVAGALGLVADEYHEQRMTARRMMQLLRDAGLESPTYRPFMWAPVAFVPYTGIHVGVRMASRFDALVRRLHVLNFTFVNQLVYGRKPFARVNPDA